MPGIAKEVLDQFDSEVSRKRIQSDIKTDFIIAPHYNAIFLKAFDELWSRTYEELNSGKYQPSLPITMSIPKKGGFSRPGSILYPTDRLVYQLMADATAEIVEKQSDRTRNFSHIYSPNDPDSLMFESPHQSWEKYSQKISEMCNETGFVIKADIANYFERIPQHHLINLLHSSGCKAEHVNLLEKVLSAFREKNSFGIVQGIYASDLFGNFYLTDLDAYCEMHNIPSARYVDDIYMKFNTYNDSSRGLIKLIERLRKNGLNLNESKSGIFSTEDIKKEETELDDIFDEARNEIEEEMRKEAEEEYYENSYHGRGYSYYGFSIGWEYEEPEIELDEDEVHYNSVERLYESIEQYPNASDKIEKFCLPILAFAGSTVAVDNSFKGIIEKPYMAKVYNSYLMAFAARDKTISSKLEKLLVDENIVTDYQYMYILAALMNCKEIYRDSVNLSLRLLEDKKVSDETRSIAAIFAAKFGSPQQKHSVKITYDGEHSDFVKSALLYSSKHFTNVERKACINAWGGHGLTNALISVALQNE